MIQILIVEDEEMILKGLQYTVDWLSMKATVIAVARNGQQGLEKIRECSPDLVITDIKMPIMDGLAMIEKALEEQLVFLPVVMTSYSDFAYAKESIRLKVFDYLLKPISDTMLADLMSRASVHIANERSRRIINELADSVESDTDIILLKTSVTNPHVKYALEKLESGYRGCVSIASIAIELKISTSYLSRVFKQECGYTFLNFLNRYRIHKAIELLSTGQHRVYEIADQCGFTDYKRFHQIFREYTDMSPSEFLKTGCCVIKKTK